MGWFTISDNKKSAIEQDLQDKEVQFLERDNSSDLIHAMNILHSSEHLESNTILTNEQVNGLVNMDWAGNVYDIEYFKNYAPSFCKYRISGDDGRGRSELIQIAEAIQKNQQEKDNRLMDLLGRK